ncbi:electron transport complex subunit RsxG [Thalassotalea marina]|uniref:Ion-translocating oxidoreductase complex subunit G n=1 Tax=Thalassotalea marina TaxID=1673741 RepID=A0A919BPH4_9GAMM|nr:electron transport complex subunit RsxG [Thalassotalea marina]GHG00888.1 electron transport complex subunit G [Thalassotalea marina]
MKKAIESNARILAVFAIACTAVVGIVNLLTKDTINKQEQRYLIKTLSQIVDPTSHDNDMTQSCVIIQDDTLGSEPQKAYLAFKGDTPVAAAITTTAPDGYSGNIYLLVAVNYQNQVTGVRTLKHQETPGLGDKIETRKSDWIFSFNGKTIESDDDSHWAVKKDGGTFDQFTGATITPRAVVNATKRTLLYFSEHKQTLFSSTQSCQED